MSVPSSRDEYRSLVEEAREEERQRRGCISVFAGVLYCSFGPYKFI